MSDHRSNQSLRLAFYGDDFTGSTDALEVLAFAGLRCALFLKVPDDQTLAELGPFDAIGVAGDSRAMTPLEMDLQLAPILSALAELPTPLVHYKVCSTFDSSPSIGSIAHVMTLARSHFGSHVIPVVAATPALGRYCVFGHLFARSGTDNRVYRIDRHPIMSAHPVTPMNEADLVRHLAAQRPMTIAKFELPKFSAGRDAIDREFSRLLLEGPQGVLFDGSEPAHLTETGRLLQQWAEQHFAQQKTPMFAVGSSGLEYALTQWWRESKLLPLAEPKASFNPVSQVLAVSGSASALSALQIDAALAADFVDVPIDPLALVSQPEAATARLLKCTLDALTLGRSVMMHTARGPKDARIDALLDVLIRGGQTRDEAMHSGGRQLGQHLGRLVDGVLRQFPLQRLLLSGGDTSSQITRALAPDALQIEAALAPGAPLCVARSSQAHLKGLQIALKGGQMGQADFFIRARDGLLPRQ